MITFSEKSGDSVENAIVISGAQNGDEGARAGTTFTPSGWLIYMGRSGGKTRSAD